MLSRDHAVAKIVAARIKLIFTGADFTDFGDAARVNRIAEVYGGTYTEAWDQVRSAYRDEIRKIASMVDAE